MRISICLFFLACFFLPRLGNGKPLRVGVEEIEYLPYWQGKGGEYIGFGRDVLDAFAKSEGLELQYVSLPVKRLYSEFLAGNVELKFPDAEYWQKDIKKGRKIKYSKGVVPFTDGVLRKKENLGKPLATLKKLGTVRAFTPWEYLDAIHANKIALVETNTMDSLLKLVAEGRVDGAYTNVAVAQNILETTPLKTTIQHDKTLPHTSNFYSISSEKHPEIIERFDRWMEKNKSLKASLLKKWHLDSAETLN